MISVQFTVPGEPKGKGRPRFLKTGRTYTPPATIQYEKHIAARALESMRGQPVNTPCSVSIVAYKGVPASWSKARRQRALQGLEVPGKPDLDNVAKAVLDALNGVVYADDVQVTRLKVKKMFSESPRLEVVIEELVE